MRITEFKLESDGTCKMFGESGGVIDRWHNVDSLAHAQILMNDYNNSLLIREHHKDVEANAFKEISPNLIEVKDAEFVYAERNFDAVNFMYFANNFHHDWMNSVWGTDTNMHKHLSDKWRNLCSRNDYGGTANFLTFFMELDDRNKDLLCDWISDNYKWKVT